MIKDVITHKETDRLDGPLFVVLVNRLHLDASVKMRLRVVRDGMAEEVLHRWKALGDQRLQFF